MNKYRNHRTDLAGYSFASKGESLMFQELKLREKAKEISDIQVQAQVSLNGNEARSRVIYKPDFKVYDTKKGMPVWVEFKGIETDAWKIKRRLWMTTGPGRLEVYKQNSRGIYLDETIIPKENVKCVTCGK